MKELAKTLLVGERTSTVIRECRRCGTGVAASTDRCPECGAAEISEYTIE